jgi:hypothetical protein
MSTEIRCRGEGPRSHAVHALDVEQVVSPHESIRLVITAPQCSVDCLCCQRAASANFAVASLFKPGVPRGLGD